MNPVATQLQAAPRVFSLQIAWQTNHEAPADIAATLSAVDEEVGGGGGQRGRLGLPVLLTLCLLGLLCLLLACMWTSCPRPGLSGCPPPALAGRPG
jgi:hypothetical protein